MNKIIHLLFKVIDGIFAFIARIFRVFVCIFRFVIIFFLLVFWAIVAVIVTIRAKDNPNAHEHKPEEYKDD